MPYRPESKSRERGCVRERHITLAKATRTHKTKHGCIINISGTGVLFFFFFVSRWFINRISYFSLVVLTFSSRCICRPKESKSSAHVAAFRPVLSILLASNFWQGSHMREWNGCGVVDIRCTFTVLATRPTSHWPGK